MKRNFQSTNPNYIIKPIVSTDKTHGRNQSQNHDNCPYDVGNAYVTVPVYRKNEKFTKKQIKDASSMYTIHRTFSHSFVLSLKSDSSVHIAVPYYRTCETVVNGKPVVTVSNFFPSSTDQATPPPGTNVIGKTAQLIQVPNNSLSSIFVYPKNDDYYGSVATPSNSIGVQPLNPIIQMKSNPSSMMSNRHLPEKPRIRNGNDLSYHPISSDSTVLEPSSKRSRNTVDGDVVKQSFWNDNEFNCVHSKEWKRQDHPDFSLISDYSLFNSFLQYMIDRRMLKVEDIPNVFKGNESSVIKIANILASFHVIKYVVIDSTTNEGIYLMPDLDENRIVPSVTERFLFDEEEMKREEADLIRLRKRVEQLENLTSSDRMTPGLVFNALGREDPSLINEPLYNTLIGLPIIRDSISNMSSYSHVCFNNTGY